MGLPTRIGRGWGFITRKGRRFGIARLLILKRPHALAFVPGNRETAGPSAPLCSGRDDKGKGDSFLKSGRRTEAFLACSGGTPDDKGKGGCSPGVITGLD